MSPTPTNRLQRDIAGLTVGQCAALACLLESTAAKPGNVQRGADFDDATFCDFAVSAVAIGPAMEAARRLGVGETVLAAISATQRLAATNTNLGTVLLLAPLAAAAPDRPLSEGLPAVLAGLDAEDARKVYTAIRLARPSGLGKVAEMDVHGEPPDCLVDAMRLAADRDLVARQYAGDFAEVFQLVGPWLAEGQRAGWKLTETIVHTQLRLLSRFRDSLIVRKRGVEAADAASRRAAAALRAGSPGDERYLRAVADLDFWLRSDGRGRNPGTVADLIAAGLFVGLRDGWLAPPFR
jgi:triphosphoribosyl-dephospho-CoA synthase